MVVFSSSEPTGAGGKEKKARVDFIRVLVKSLLNHMLSNVLILLEAVNGKVAELENHFHRYSFSNVFLFCFLCIFRGRN